MGPTHVNLAIWNQRPFHYTWRAPGIRFRDTWYSGMETTFFIQSLWSKLSDSYGAGMLNRLLICDTSHTVSSSLGTRHQRNYKLMETPLGDSQSVVTQPQKVTQCVLCHHVTVLLCKLHLFALFGLIGRPFPEYRYHLAIGNYKGWLPDTGDKPRPARRSICCLAILLQSS